MSGLLRAEKEIPSTRIITSGLMALEQTRKVLLIAGYFASELFHFSSTVKPVLSGHLKDQNWFSGPIMIYRLIQVNF